ncbi:hypothetical protein PAXRUDRAFT_824967 [Paxillus rubicundulus Ve08.2h10]|uniref:Uncharacterized protein n=1 Tax=Paxillus rubicundulus Ve08.2h10 TaxID=930991 RepID=A0A0D0DH26_9AGAM|nr:hypothetical protein PAXRUDRAFT_824967 [Paxillus rubicundulus Ve08.2h10]
MFLGASDLLMIIRVFAMYNRSKTILSILFVIYISNMALTIVPLVSQMTRKLRLSVYLADVVDVPLCIVPDITIPIPSRYLLGSRFILGAFLCIFAVTKFVRQSLETYKEIKQWRSNRYMELLVRESILYFVINLLSNALITTVTSGMQSIVSIITIAILPYVIAPRFVISIREFHSRAVEHIDTGFGAASQHVSPDDNMMFASVGDMPWGDADAAGGEGGSEGARVWPDNRDPGMGEETADGARA